MMSEWRPPLLYVYIAHVLTAKGAKRRVSLQQIIARLGVELLKFQLEGLSGNYGPHARDTVGIVAGIVGRHDVLIQRCDYTTAC